MKTAKGDGPGTLNCKALGIAQRGGAFKMIVVQDLKAFRIERIASKNVDAARGIYIDAAKLYRFLMSTGKHDYITHKRAWKSGDVHTNTIESAWSLFKRGIIGVHHYVGAGYLQDYLDEFAFRYSRRKNRGVMFDLVLANC